MRTATAWQAASGRAKCGFAAKSLSKHLSIGDLWLGEVNSGWAASVFYDYFSCDPIHLSAGPNAFSVQELVLALPGSEKEKEEGEV